MPSITLIKNLNKEVNKIMKAIFSILGIVIFILLIRLLSSDGGISEYRQLNAKLQAIQAKNEKLKSSNLLLKREVKELQSSTKIIETIARQKLGMIKEDEIFIKVIELEKKPN
jgi:cell division protein FtsB